MSKQIIINLPVQNSELSKNFFKSLDLPLNEKLSDEKATCFNIDENIIIALLPVEHFSEIITNNTVADMSTNEMLLAIGMETQQDVDDMLNKAVLAGANELHERVSLPDIYAGSFKDLDGHMWNIFYMR